MIRQLKSKLKEIINNCFFHKNGNRRDKYVFLEYLDTYFVKYYSDVHTKYFEVDVIKMLDFHIDNICVLFSGQLFQQTVGIPMGRNCAPILADLFLYGYEAEFIQGLLEAGKKHLAQKLYFTYRYIDGVLSYDNSKISEFIDRIYPCELVIKDTVESNTSALYLDC